MVFFDVSLANLLEGIKDKIPTVKRYIAMCTVGLAPPTTSLPNVITYESFILPGSGNASQNKNNKKTRKFCDPGKLPRIRCVGSLLHFGNYWESQRSAVFPQIYCTFL
jgi:hypothetical protein